MAIGLSTNLRSNPSLGRHLSVTGSLTRGLVLGKFLPYHAGHAHVIRTARAQVDELTVLVCSIRSESIPGPLRFRWVRDAHPDCRVLHVTEEVPQAPEDHPDFWPIWTDLIARHAGTVERVFTSETYGDELAARLGARHTCIDKARKAFPVSGTLIRNDPLTHWAFIPPTVRPYFVRRVAILGAESTGKSTLAASLARQFDTVHVPEFGRAYCEARSALDLALPDFEAIAHGQADWEEEHATRANRVLICDTELHTTATWSDMVIGTRPSWLTAAARARKYHLLLVLDDDVPWSDDGTRVFADRRSEHTLRLQAELETAGREFVMLSGSFEERELAAARLIAELLVAGTPTR